MRVRCARCSARRPSRPPRWRRPRSRCSHRHRRSRRRRNWRSARRNARSSGCRRRGKSRRRSVRQRRRRRGKSSTSSARRTNGARPKPSARHRKRRRRHSAPRTPRSRAILSRSSSAASRPRSTWRSSGPALANWQAQITAKISRAWLRPPTARAGIECVLNVTQVPGGEVTEVSIGECNGGPGGARVDRGGRLSRLPPATAAGPGALRAQPQDQL